MASFSGCELIAPLVGIGIAGKQLADNADNTKANEALYAYVQCEEKNKTTAKINACFAQYDAKLSNEDRQTIVDVFDKYGNDANFSLTLTKEERAQHKKVRNYLAARLKK